MRSAESGCGQWFVGLKIPSLVHLVVYLCIICGAAMTMKSKT